MALMAEDQNASIEEVASSSDSLTQTSQEMQQEVQKFKL